MHEHPITAKKWACLGMPAKLRVCSTNRDAESNAKNVPQTPWRDIKSNNTRNNNRRERSRLTWGQWKKCAEMTNFNS